MRLPVRSHWLLFQIRGCYLFELSALEASGAGEVISEPRIVTTNRRPATIRQGSQISFVTRDENGAITY
jgi:Type II secretory pathway, component HofQ